MNINTLLSLIVIAHTPVIWYLYFRNCFIGEIILCTTSIVKRFKHPSYLRNSSLHMAALSDRLRRFLCLFFVRSKRSRRQLQKGFTQIVRHCAHAENCCVVVNENDWLGVLVIQYYVGNKGHFILKRNQGYIYQSHVDRDLYEAMIIKKVNTSSCSCLRLVCVNSFINACCLTCHFTSYSNCVGVG